MSHPGGLNVILKHAASCQKAAATREAFHITLLFTLLMCSNASADYSSFRKTQGKLCPKIQCVRTKA